MFARRTRWRQPSFLWGRQQPPIGYEVNRLSPWADGLIGAWIFNAKTGVSIADLSGNARHARLNNAGTLAINQPFWTIGDRGAMLSMPINTVAAVLEPGLPQGADPIWVRSQLTIMARYRPRDVTTVNVWLGKSMGAGGFDPGWRYYWEATGPGALGRSTFDACSGAFDRVKAAGNLWTPTVDGFHTVAVTKNSLDYTFYRDAADDGTAAAALHPTLPTSTASPKLGQGDIAGPDYLFGDLEWIYIWGRVLTAAEIADITAAPYDLIEPYLWRGNTGTVGVLAMMNPVVNVGTGRLVAAFPQANGTVITFYSTDEGATWTQGATIPDLRGAATPPTSKLRSPSDGQLLFGLKGDAASSPQIARSLNSGVSWLSVLTLSDDNVINNFVVMDEPAALAELSPTAPPINPYFTADNEHMSVPVGVSDNTIFYITNAIGADMTLVNDADAPLVIIGTGLVLSKANANISGHYLGWTLRGEDPPYRIETVEMEAAPSRTWDNSP